MEHIQKLLDKSDDLLDAEMTRSQSLIEDIKNLYVKYEELESRHETLSTTHEKLSYDYLQRKQELEIGSWGSSKGEQVTPRSTD